MGCAQALTLDFKQGYAELVPSERRISQGPSRLYFGDGRFSWMNFDYVKDVASPFSIIYTRLDRFTEGRRTMAGGLALRRTTEDGTRVYEFSREEFALIKRHLSSEDP